MYYARVTTLESFRRMLYLNHDVETEYDTEKSFLEALKGEFKGNDKTVIGSAFHKIVEQGEKACASTERGAGESSPDAVKVEIDGQTVVFNCIQYDAAIAYRAKLRGMFNEVPAGKVYSTRYGDIKINGTVDVLHGEHIRDIKTRFSGLKQQEYIDSYQWRFYLDMFELRQFWYDVFEFTGFKFSTDASGLNLKVHEPFDCLAYINMQTDLHILIDEFLDYIKFRGLEQYVAHPAEKYR
jgi:hypothetical protein